ncbi:MAG: hypothetical protein J5595_10620 [Bacteroidales bacterium]|nr:hypothetical protein [Bacteroidales bacterium]
METNNTQTAKEYTEEERRELIKNFFSVTKLDSSPFIRDPRMLLVLVAVFVGFVLLGYLKRAIPTIVLCTTCFGYALWQLYLIWAPYLDKRQIFRRRPTEDQMSSWLIKDLKENVKPKSITTLGLNMEDVKPENFIIIPIPIYWVAPGIDNLSHVKRCLLSDGTYTYSMWRVQILVLTKHFISLFKCNYDWFDNSISSISTNEFYFQDITSIRNDMREIEYKFIDNDEMPIGGGKVFCVTNFSGEYLTVVNEIPSLQITDVVAVNLEYIVSLLRMVIRNRRFGITHEEMSREEQQALDGSGNNDDNQDTSEEINSIEYLLNKRDDEMNQQESQFGGTPFSSFDDGSDSDTTEHTQQ